MQLEGSIRTMGPAEDVVRGLAHAQTLEAIAPAGFEFRKVEDGVANFLIRRSFGPISLTLQGTMGLTEVAEGAWKLEIKAAHLIGGRVLVALDLTAGEEAGSTEEGLETLSWRGELTAQGLAGRLLGEREPEGNNIMRNLFLRLRDHTEKA